MSSRLDKFLQKRGETLLVIYILLGGVLLCIFRTLHSANFAFAFKYLSAPILVLSFYIYFFKMKKVRAKEGPITGPLLTLFFTFILIAVSAGYVSAVNAFGPGQRDIIFHGKVTELKTMEHRRGMSYHVVLTNERGRSIELPLTRAEYETLAVGQRYATRWRLGSLGMLYKPRMSSHHNQSPPGPDREEKK